MICPIAMPSSDDAPEPIVADSTAPSREPTPSTDAALPTTVPPTAETTAPVPLPVLATVSLPQATGWPHSGMVQVRIEFTEECVYAFGPDATKPILLVWRIDKVTVQDNGSIRVEDARGNGDSHEIRNGDIVSFGGVGWSVDEDRAGYVSAPSEACDLSDPFLVNWVGG